MRIASTGMRMVVWGALLVCPAAAWAGTVASPGSGDLSHRMMLLVVQLGVILLAAKIGHLLTARIGLPGVLGEVFAGLVIGPYLLGALPLPGLPHGLFFTVGGFPVSPELYGVCVLASVVLLFMVGLETDIHMFMRYSGAATLIGVGGVVGAFVVGDLTMVAFSHQVLGEPLGFFAAPCLLLGIISTATSVGITASILVENRKLETPEGVTILAAAVVDDVLGIILLAVAMGVITATGDGDGVNWARIGVIALKVVGIWLAATITGLLVAHRVSSLLKGVGDRATIAVMALGLALIVAGLFEQAGLAMIIGAYVAGLSLSRTDLRHVIREHLESAYAVLVPIFFAVMGMLVNLRMILVPEMILFSLVFALLATVSKVAGCGLPALLCGFNARGAMRIGCGMLPRGEVALLISGTALATGLLNQELFGVVIMMTLITTVIAPPLLLWLFRHGGSGTRHETGPSDVGDIVFTFPSAETASFLLARLLHVFEQDGFFVHEISRHDKAYQLLRERMMINLRQEGATLRCACGGREAAVVSAAMLDVLADFERIVGQLRQPVDRRAISRGVQAPAPAGTTVGGESLRPYLSPAALVPRLAARTREAVIAELLGCLQAAGRVGDPIAARTAVLAREHGMSTGMQHGIALPHARTDAVSGLVCAIGLAPGGITDYPALDGSPVRIVVLTLAPRHLPAPHMQLMAAISQKLDTVGRERLLACTTAEDMFAALTSPPATP